MKFLVDAHLPKHLAYLLREKGFDVVHTTELPDGNDTTDSEINRISLTEDRIVISKDMDFYDSFTAKKEPTNCFTLKQEISKTHSYWNYLRKIWS
jgi:predicted nuclease of predicted toxin-antitoxin system